MGKKVNPFKGKNILSLSDFSPQSLSFLFAQAEIMRSAPGPTAANTLRGSVIALLFFEPSTRTHNSFSSAAQRLGAGVIGIQDTSITSMHKGESFEDTIRMMAGYSHAIVIRHKEPGSALRASQVAAVPVINGGDGGNEHPTQTVLDLYTIYREFGRLDNLTVVLGIDPLHSRTIRSLLIGLSLYKNNTAYVISPGTLRLSDDIRRQVQSGGLKLIEIESERDIPADAHVWYWNRVQRERFGSAREYNTFLKKFTITPQLLKQKGNDDMIIMDPLPRIEEIAIEVDTDPRARYFQQAQNGVFIRMAFLKSILAKTV